MNLTESAMIKSKLVQLLKTFSKDEFKSFGKFLSSPYFYKDRAVIKLYKTMKKFYPDYNNKEMVKSLVFEKMYPGRKYSNTQMKYLMSETFSLAKRFLSYNDLEKDIFEINIRLLKELNKRSAHAIFESRLKTFKTVIESYPIRNEEYFHQMYRMQELTSDFYSYKDRYSPMIMHKSIVENIFNSFFISILNSYYEITNNIPQSQTIIDLKLISYIEYYINSNKGTVNPVVYIYYCIFMLSYRREKIFYQELHSLKNKYLYALDNHGRHRIFEALGNYCVYKYQQGEVKYYREAFNITNDEINSGVRFRRKEFSEIFFTNKVEIAAKVKEFNWAYDFIEKYTNRLNIQNRIDIVNFCKAIIEFESKNYVNSLDLLTKINLRHLHFFRIRNYTLLNYYELNYIESAYSLIDSYRHMLEKDKKIETSRKERYKAFLNFYQKLLGMKSGYNKFDKELLKTNIEQSPVFMKQWLLEKIGEL